MTGIYPSFKKAWSLLKKDRIVLFLTLMPLVIGFTLYAGFGTLVLTHFREWGEEWIRQKTTHPSLGTFLQGLLWVLLSLILFFIFNWTFVLLVSLLSSPFNGALSARVEKLLDQKPVENWGQVTQGIISSFFKNMGNELKKISLILILTLLALLLNFFPLLSPLSFLLSALLLAIQFLDYNWGRHEWPIGDCMKDLKRNIVSYGVTGGLFILAMTVPLLNVMAIPFAVIFYSCLWNFLNGKGRA